MSADMSDDKSQKDLPVIVKEEWCKGCYICVEFCPTKVLELIDTKAKVVAPEKCIFCKLCEIRCPDFAITVDMSKKKKEQ